MQTTKSLGERLAISLLLATVCLVATPGASKAQTAGGHSALLYEQGIPYSTPALQKQELEMRRALICGLTGGHCAEFRKGTAVPVSRTDTWAAPDPVEELLGRKLGEGRIFLPRGNPVADLNNAYKTTPTMPNFQNFGPCKVDAHTVGSLHEK